MPFSSIIGHTKQLRYLSKLLENGHVSHAYLFFGPKHLGKATIARQFLTQLLGTSLDHHPDASVLTGEESIRVEEIRLLRTHLSLSSMQGGKKVALIDNAEQMTPSAQNALLKTLEEPRGDTVMILVSHHPDVLLPTIRSRCVQMAFSPVAQQDVPEGFAYCAGRPGVAIRLQEPEYAKSAQAVMDDAQAFLDAPLWKRFTMIESWVKEKRELPLSQWEVSLHDRLADGDTAAPLRALGQLRVDLSRNSNKQLALQNFAASV